ncbi:MAG TPA: hypothetical protein VGC92_14175 [Phenylobacterium sp.]|jgi:hypothetical protein
MSARRASAAALILLAGALVGAFAPLARTTAMPTPVAEIARTDFIAEGVAVVPRGLLLVSGVEGRTILRLTPMGAAPWLKGRAEGGLFGMAVDAAHDRLWVAETGGAKVPGGAGPAATGVLEVRLSDGRVLQRHPAPNDGKDHWIGDVALAADGTVYASDSVGGLVYRLRPGGGGLEVTSDTGLRSPQGLVPTSDGKGLILADYATGLHVVDLATGAVGPAMPAGGKDLRGIDGLKRHGGDLIATRNGTDPQVIMRLTLARGERDIAAWEYVARGPQVLEDLSLGDVDRDRFVFVARSGWAAFDDDGHPNGKPHLTSVIAALPLAAGSGDPP